MTFKGSHLLIYVCKTGLNCEPWESLSLSGSCILKQDSNSFLTMKTRKKIFLLLQPRALNISQLAEIIIIKKRSSHPLQFGNAPPHPVPRTRSSMLSALLSALLAVSCPLSNSCTEAKKRTVRIATNPASSGRPAPKNFFQEMEMVALHRDQD